MRYKLIALLVLQLCFAGFHIVSRVALNMGLSKVVYPVYRNLIALLSLGPFAYFFAYLLAFNKKWNGLYNLHCGIRITANQGFFLLGLYYASPTFASAMQNSVPAITFLMALAVRYIFRALFFIFFSFFCTSSVFVTC